MSIHNGGRATVTDIHYRNIVGQTLYGSPVSTNPDHTLKLIDQQIVFGQYCSPPACEDPNDRGSISHVSASNIRVSTNGLDVRLSRFEGNSSAHAISDVAIQDFSIDSVKVTSLHGLNAACCPVCLAADPPPACVVRRYCCSTNEFIRNVTVKTDDEDSAVPNVTLFPNVDNVAGAPWRAGSASKHIAYLGLMNTTAQCEKACLNGPLMCCSFTFNTPAWEPTKPKGWTRQCFGRTNGVWTGAKVGSCGEIVSGRVAWPNGSAKAQACRSVAPPPPPPAPPSPPSGPCKDALDCALNGRCVAGKCQCRAAWKGDRCQTLTLQPANLDAGYRHVDAEGKNISSWGGSGEDDAAAAPVADLVARTDVREADAKSALV